MVPTLSLPSSNGELNENKNLQSIVTVDFSQFMILLMCQSRTNHSSAVFRTEMGNFILTKFDVRASVRVHEPMNDVELWLKAAAPVLHKHSSAQRNVSSLINSRWEIRRSLCWTSNRGLYRQANELPGLTRVTLDADEDS